MDAFFENIYELPNKHIQLRSKSLIGFNAKFEQIMNNLQLIMNPEGILKWGKKFHGVKLPVFDVIQDRHPLIIFTGDVGTGKTVTAEGIADQIIRDLDREGFLLKLSTRVRGQGLHGEMSKLIQMAFERVIKEAGKKRLAFLLIDEADAIASTRGTLQMHQEEKAAVNTLIQKIDDLRALKGRAVVLLTTNRANFLDEAIVRRSCLQLSFSRPNNEELLELLKRDLAGVNLSKNEFIELAKLVGPKANNGAGFSFSDIRLRFLPEAIAQVFPDKPLSFEILSLIAKSMEPSPEIK